MWHNRGLSAITVYLVALLVGSWAAGVGFDRWADGRSAFTSTASVQLTFASNSGDVDRAVASQVQTLSGDGLKAEVVARLASPDDFTTTAEQVRLTNVVDVTVRSEVEERVQPAATETINIYLERLQAVAVPENGIPLVAGTLTSPASAPEQVYDLVRDRQLARLAGAIVAAVALGLLLTLRPRLRTGGTPRPVAGYQLQLPHPWVLSGRQSEARTTAVRRLVEHAAAQSPAGTARGTRVTVVPLPGAGGRQARWVAAAARAAHAGPDVDVVVTSSAVPSARSRRAQVTVVIARAWLHSQEQVAREAASRAVFSETITVVLGARRAAVIADPALRPDVAAVGPRGAAALMRAEPREDELDDPRTWDADDERDTSADVGRRAAPVKAPAASVQLPTADDEPGDVNEAGSRRARRTHDATWR